MTQAPVNRFQKVREDNAAERAADYVELIQDLLDEFGEARATDLASRLGVSHVTVTKALQKLSRQGFVTYRPYRSIFLTDEGATLAREIRERHSTVLTFLLSIGVPQEIAELDAEGIEHHVSPATFAALRQFNAKPR